MKHLQDIEEAEDLLLTDDAVHWNYPTPPLVGGGQGRTNQEVHDMATGLLVLVLVFVVLIFAVAFAGLCGFWS